ncbi:hypothetical protein MUU77_07785 [Pseudoxanthomonas sp. F37]|uniref:hypothetical protein n=1 Tax=Pseudoxanthomonas TaxID=83618 RepID=UPI001FD57EAA|nr:MULTISPECIES: hypothetical protein [Pseudoxanthomonas]UOV05174.1 hypothetical protein MUU75_19300 [Pseudoxanthomonas mexicana]UOV10169.1 hypothetical protein MUU77_07785 [Pseudoxanthomonas sp. F37]
MATHRLGRDTTSIDELVWNGEGFGDVAADAMWSELSSQLKLIAIAELHAGNIPVDILRNEAREIVVLSFQRPPISQPPLGSSVKVHRRFADGNYCYDGTLCTYEDLESGDFLAFNDPDYVEDA